LDRALDMKVPLLFLLLGGCHCQDLYHHQGEYQFSYAVEDGNSGNQYGHSENRLGSATEGAYHVLLPDGRVQTVEYTVDSYAGYKATVHYDGVSQEFLYDPVKKEYEPLKPVKPVKSLHQPLKPVYASSKPVYSQVKQNYNLYNPVPPLVNPANSKPTLSNYNQPTPYQTSFSFLHPTFVQYQEPTDPNHPSYNQIYDTPPVPYLAPKKLKPPVLYQPQSYQPAPVQNYHPIHNLLVRPSSHHRVLKDPHVKPLAPPEHKKHKKNLKPDPFLVSEEELRGRDFSDPFWYPLERKIVKGYRKEEKKKELV